MLRDTTDEGHDVLKYANRVTFYTAIAGFFEKHLYLEAESGAK
jgi:dipeptidyl aminopeptidase/acylaminoacyl peptidase